MKSIWLLLFIMFSNLCYSQYINDVNIYEGILANLYLNHQPSAKGEAMGRGLAANSDGSYGSYYNPALTSLSRGLNFDYSYSQSDRVKPSLNYYGVSYSNEKIGSFGLSAYNFSKPLEDDYGFAAQRKHSYYDAIFTLNYSREVVKDFYAGINFGVFHYYNYYHWANATLPGGHFFIDDGVTLDLGLLKKFSLKTPKNEHTFQIAAALYNFTNSKVISDEGNFINKEALPVTLRIGASHQLKIPNGIHSGVPYPLQMFTHIEYDKMVNSEFHGTFRIGEELSVWEVLYLRVGYFYSSVHDGYRESESELTYGAGLSIPLSRLLKTKNKFDIKIDYVRTDIDKYERYNYNTSIYYNKDYGTFYTFGLSLNYIP